MPKLLTYTPDQATYKVNEPNSAKDPTKYDSNIIFCK